jgi:hypothetical protein
VLTSLLVAQVGIDATKSNELSGKNTFGGHNLHGTTVALQFAHAHPFERVADVDWNGMENQYLVSYLYACVSTT